MSSETTKVVIEDRWVWYEKSDGEWQLFTRNGGNGEIRSRAVTSHVSPVRIGTLLDALAAAQRENETMREALRDIRDNFDHETYTRQHGPQGYSGNCRCCVAYAALSGQGGR